MRRSATTLTIAGIVLAGVLFISVNRLAVRLFGDAGFDLTDQGLYTVSPGTRAILARIDEPITLKFYYSTRLGQLVPSYGVYAQRVRQMLQGYAALSHGKIRLEILDPMPYSEIEDQATAAGLQGAPAGQGSETVYFGLVGSNSTDDTETIPFFQADRENFLEYDLTKLVQSLAFPKKKVVGLISSLTLDGDPVAQMRGQPSQPEAVLEQLRQNYEVRDISTSIDAIPDDVDVLMIAQPEKLAPKTQYAIDQFVLGGGHVLVFADPYSEFSAGHRSPMAPPGGATAADFDKMLNSWGVNLVKGKLVGDRLAATKVNFGADEHSEPVDYVLWMSLRGDDINANDPITAKLTELNIGTAARWSR
ncbi:MAG: GldG family protein [Rhodospirillales bacterium]